MNSVANKVHLIGNLGCDPEMKEVTGGYKLVKLPLATSEGFTNKKGEREQRTQWHNLVFWGKSAEIAQRYLHKGSKIAVEGRIAGRSYEDKDGQKRFITEIMVGDFLFLGGKPGKAEA